jgi:DNA-binding beta-propeller fold protein YncE
VLGGGIGELTARFRRVTFTAFGQALAKPPVAPPEVIATIRVGSVPQGVAVNPVTNTAYATNKRRQDRVGDQRASPPATSYRTVLA